MVWLQYFKKVRDLSLFRLANALEFGDVEENVHDAFDDFLVSLYSAIKSEIYFVWLLQLQHG